MQAQETELAKRGFGPFFFINTCMKIIAINLTDIDQSNFVIQISKILNYGVVCLSYKDFDATIDTNDLYTKLSLGALTLEQYAIDNKEFATYDKTFINCLMFWNPNIDKVKSIIPYTNLLIKNWLLFDNQNSPNWVFGNVSTCIKWAGSLYKLKQSDFHYTHPHLTNELTPSIVYAGRIGLNVQGVV